MSEGQFVWYELMTNDARAAEAFYERVVGWRMRDAGHQSMRYTLACSGDARVGGIMVLPPEARAQGARPSWLGYVAVEDVDAKTEEVRALGGAVHRAPDDIPGIGRFSVVADPQGAAFVLFRGDSPPPPQPSPGTPGLAGWHELYAKEWGPAFAFYEALFGWRKDEALDLGPMGTYQLFNAGGPAIGGMMSLPGVPEAAWLYYFGVDDIDAATERLVEAGGAVRNGPMQVPGGDWIVQAADPQGANFALVGTRVGDAPQAA